MSTPDRHNGLQYLPAIPFETVLTYVDLESIKALRLTNRTLAEKCIGPRFLKSIEHPTLDFSLQKIRNLLVLTRDHVISQKVRSLAFFATTIDSSRLEKSIISGKYIERVSFGFRQSYEKTKEVYTPEGLSNAKSDLIWLKEQEEARDKESSSETIQLLQLVFKRFENLQSIHLDGAVIYRRTDRGYPSNGKWYSFWLRAWHVFTMVMTAMVQTGVSMKKLNFYRGTRRCCIPAGKITAYASGLSQTELEVLCKGLQSLELSISGEISDAFGLAKADPPWEWDEEEPPVRPSGSPMEHLFSGDDPRAALADGTPGITSLFLKNAFDLRELSLTFRRTVPPGSSLMNSYDGIIHSIAHDTRFPMLESCSFAGFPAKMDSILLFLKNHSNLRSFTLHECYLTTGSWTPIFAHLDRSMPRLENLSFSNLFGKHMQNLRYAQPLRNFGESSDNEQEQQSHPLIGEREGVGMVVLLPIWDTDEPEHQKEFLRMNGRAVHTRTFTRDELKKGLVFRPLHPDGGRPLGSPHYTNWYHRREDQYGLLK
ncbi:hypothetical protein BO94DRAFT_524192 [Aspergillus sclerotioniger CBS 115572]|uniref:Uncharacterized protein n=1 Tax=Aspergillus sclerotioniger CBS 115572 TaxID=1450535 RepID=A0A317VLQ8_9EURO|nr:hypothetical protein BO94DRAFT_524192 [Aspergillus sclerotioniger CBS 115572]PWY75303.1 hypothetical protein BO94DRAFT_524192 [Aspergillus sclerotioniger CBS 115572]